MSILKVNYIGKQLHAQGPGTRYTIWVQGCSIHCPGCSNIDTWDPAGGTEYDVQELVKDILATEDIDGVTITGGEPLDQFDAVYELCNSLFNKICIFLTTGYFLYDGILTGDRPKYSFSEVARWLKILKVLDIICYGGFEQDKICKDGWRGSSNQEVNFLTKLGESQKNMPSAYKEIIISPDGRILETGFHV
jgi:anaerobic ribonucleoside-triphosphate reductase activating protein